MSSDNGEKIGDEVIQTLEEAYDYVQRARRAQERTRGLVFAALVFGFLLGYAVSDWVDALGRVTN